MKTTLGKVRELLREAQEGPDDELKELAEELYANMNDVFGGALNVMDPVWRKIHDHGDHTREVLGHEFEFTVSNDDAYKYADFLKNVVDAASNTMKMITGDSMIRISGPKRGAIYDIYAGDNFHCQVVSDWDQSSDGKEYHYAHVTIRRRW